MTSSHACNKFSSPERPVEHRDISWLYGGLHEDTGIFILLKKRILVSPRGVADGAVALVAPGAKRFFGAGIGRATRPRLTPLGRDAIRRTDDCVGNQWGSARSERSATMVGAEAERLTNTSVA